MFPENRLLYYMIRYSIITVNRNNADGLKKTIKSVICQTCTDYEYVIIDGGSTDGSVDVIREFEDRITYWISENDKGIYNAMNKGISVSTGDYLLFLNSGDVFYNDHVLELVNQTHTNSDLLIGRESLGGAKPSTFSPQEITMMSLFKKPLPHQATFISKKLFENCLYDENYSIVADWKFWIQKLIIENCTYEYLNVIVDIFDTNGVSLNSNGRGEKECERMFKELLYPRCINDYRKYNHLDDEWIEFGHKIFYSYRLKKITYKIIDLILKIFK